MSDLTASLFIYNDSEIRPLSDDPDGTGSMGIRFAADANDLFSLFINGLPISDTAEAKIATYDRLIEVLQDNRARILLLAAKR